MEKCSELTGPPDIDATLLKVRDLAEKLEEAAKKAPSIRCALAVQRAALQKPQIRACPYCEDTDGLKESFPIFPTDGTALFCLTDL
jgi:hypothetical protein